jgi:anti-sigma regulatory factor (Ser/Thr protein kinase)
MFYSEILPKEPGSAARARRLLDRLGDEIGSDVLDNARLLVTELVANAVEHVPEAGDIEVRVRLAEGTLRVEVLDSGAGFTPAPPPADSARGWGLVFIDRLASRWAIERDGRSRVWFELSHG